MNKGRNLCGHFSAYDREALKSVRFAAEAAEVDGHIEAASASR